jgi:hypothetical protein
MTDIDRLSRGEAEIMFPCDMGCAKTMRHSHDTRCNATSRTPVAEALSRLRAENKALLRAFPRWRPIESAPKGEELFFAGTANGRIMIVRGDILASMLERSTPNHLQFPAVKWMPYSVLADAPNESGL